MRTAIKISLVVLAVAIVALIAVVLGGLHSNEFTMPDGTVVRVEKVAYGKFENFHPGGWLAKLKQKLPQAWRKGILRAPSSVNNIGSWRQITRVHTNDDALYVYCTLRDPAANTYQNTMGVSAEILDEHGCVFHSTQAGGEPGGLTVMTAAGPVTGSDYPVGWFRFEAFPRHERKIRLRILGAAKARAEFVVLNPAPPPNAKNWAVENLPITKKDGDVSFILADLKTNENPRLGANWFGGGRVISPKYQVIEGGQPSENWQALDTEVYDSSGNFASGMLSEARYLCPREEAWKLRVRFFASEHSPGASNTTWTLHGIKVPADGKAISLSDSQELDGVMLRTVTFAGPGKFVYANETLIESSPLTNSLEESSFDRSSGRRIDTIVGKTPHLLANVGDVTDDQRLTLRATDDQGREYYAWEWNQLGRNPPYVPKPPEINYLTVQRYGQHRAFLSLDLPPDVKTVDLTFCIHNARTEEFIFKPPTQEKH